jgi:hypothetical protein
VAAGYLLRVYKIECEQMRGALACSPPCVPAIPSAATEDWVVPNCNNPFEKSFPAMPTPLQSLENGPGVPRYRGTSLAPRELVANEKAVGRINAPALIQGSVRGPLLEDYIPCDGRMLDFGCGGGLLLKDIGCSNRAREFPGISLKAGSLS